jgi:hypothetical protein
MLPARAGRKKGCMARSEARRWRSVGAGLALFVAGISALPTAAAAAGPARAGSAPAGTVEIVAAVLVVVGVVVTGLRAFAWTGRMRRDERAPD